MRVEKTALDTNLPVDGENFGGVACGHQPGLFCALQLLDRGDRGYEEHSVVEAHHINLTNIQGVEIAVLEQHRFYLTH